ncbi:F0F1 ATP synthase subunit delta [Microseira sp. BLCC-F43]|uniref:F0F1 ATP synthase subunit delta n=1 Tax=Microseira sp. BLCC-F43 TaxID=3153602 RepID=UPI0035BA0A5E
MEINWLTFFAQIVNFLILVAVLQRFLYGPITRAMDRREQKISDRLQAAEKQREEAQAEAEKYRQMQQEFAGEREAMFSQLKAEVEQTRKALMENMREEVDNTSRRWQEGIKRQQDAFMLELRHRASVQVQSAIRHALIDLANVDLEQQMIEAFIERMENLNECAIASLNHNSNPIVVCSSFEIPESARAKIIQAVRDKIPSHINLEFETEPDLICGIELRASGYKLAWSVANYLDRLEESLSAVFEEETGIA